MNSKHFQQATWNVSGPRKFSGRLPRPVGDTPAWRNLAVGVGLRPAGELAPGQLRYREIAVQAVPRRPGKSQLQVVITASSSRPAYPPGNVADGAPGSFWVSGGYKPGDAPSKDKPEWVRVDFGEPFTARSLRLIPRDPYGPREVELQAADDGGEFRTVQSFQLAQGQTNAVAFPEATARSWRVLVTASHTTENVQITELQLGDMPRIANATSSVLAGVVVGSVEISDRFLYDYRRTSSPRPTSRSAKGSIAASCILGPPRARKTVCLATSILRAHTSTAM